MKKLLFFIPLLLLSQAIWAAVPNTSMSVTPAANTYSRSASFAFTGSTGTTVFECKLDTGIFQACVSPKTYSSLVIGSHSFQVRAKNVQGADATPAIATWRINTTPLQNTLNTNSPLGTNVPTLDQSDAIWLINQFPRGSGWLTQCDETCNYQWDTAEQSQLQLDANGWVRSFGSNPNRRFTSVAAVLYAGASHLAPTGNWTVLYEGQGTIDYGFSPFVQVISRAPGRDVLKITPQVDSLLRIRISNINPSNHLRNIRVLLPGGICGTNATAYAASSAACPSTFRSFEKIYTTQRFHPLFLKELQNYRTLRFMQFMGTVSDQLNAANLNQTQQTRYWSQRTTINHALWTKSGPPPHELMFELSNAVSADAWVNVNFWANDEYVRNLAMTALNSLAPNLKVYVEWSNEVWNGAYPYGVYGARIEQWAQKRWPNATFPDGTPASGFTKRMNYVGMRSDQVCRIWKSVWGTQANRVQCVMPGGPFDYPAAEALDCPFYAAQVGVPNCATRMSAVAAAPYFGGYIDDNPNSSGGNFTQLNAWTLQADGGLSSLFNELNTGSLLRLPTAVGGALPPAREVMRDNKQVANQFGLRLVAYEGGQHLTPLSLGGTGCGDWSIPSGWTAANCTPYRRIQNLFMKANRDSRMSTLYTNYLNAWKQQGGDLFVHYHTLGQFSPQFGSWGAKEYAGQPETQTPKYRALMQFKTNNTCWWSNCNRPALAP